MKYGPKEVQRIICKYSFGDFCKYILTRDEFGPEVLSPSHLLHYKDNGWFGL